MLLENDIYNDFGELLTHEEDELVQEWLGRHGPFDAVIDGANVGLVNQHNFSFYQVKKMLRIISQSFNVFKPFY